MKNRYFFGRSIFLLLTFFDLQDTNFETKHLSDRYSSVFNVCYHVVIRFCFFSGVTSQRAAHWIIGLVKKTHLFRYANCSSPFYHLGQKQLQDLVNYSIIYTSGFWKIQANFTYHPSENGSNQEAFFQNSFADFEPLKCIK